MFCVLLVLVLAMVLGLVTLLSLELPLALAVAPVVSDCPPPPPPLPGFPSVPVVVATALDCMYLGISMLLRTGWIRNSWSVKLKSGGSSRPLGSRVPCSRSSLKNECAHACRGVIRNDGVYSNNRATRSIASGGVRALNTCNYRQIHKTCSTFNTCYFMITNIIWLMNEKNLLYRACNCDNAINCINCFALAQYRFNL